MERVDRYRLNAEKCLQLAQTLNHVEAKRELLVMANAWLILAAEREKKIETAPANEPPSPVNEPRPPLDEPPTPPPVNDPPPVRLNSALPDGSKLES